MATGSSVIFERSSFKDQDFRTFLLFMIKISIALFMIKGPLSFLLAFLIAPHLKLKAQNKRSDPTFINQYLTFLPHFLKNPLKIRIFIKYHSN